MAQKGKKKPSQDNHPGRKADETPKEEREGAGSTDWTPGDPAAAEADLILDVDPAQEIVDKAREFGPSDNPFVEKADDKLPEENPIPMPLAEDEVFIEEESPGPESRRPPEEDRESALLQEGLALHGMNAVDKGESRLEGFPPEMLPGSSYLNGLFLGFHFPSGKEAVACHLAMEAYNHGGPAETFHDLVIQLDQTFFKDLHDLKSALGERFAWESDHGGPQGGEHGR